VSAPGWHGRVWRLAGPIIVSNLSLPLLGAVDTGIMGHLEAPAYIGAVALGAVVLSYLYWGFGFLRMTTTGFTAQAAGRGDDAELRLVFARSLLLGLIVGILAIALQGPILRTALALLDGSPEVERLAGAYFAVRIWGAPATFANYVIIGWLLGRQRATTTLWLQLLMNATNAALDFAFVVGFGWGVEGVAAGTIIAEYLAAVIGLVVVGRRLVRIHGPWSWSATLDAAKIRALVSVNGDIFLRTLCLVTTFALFTANGAAQGDAVLAANAVLVQFLMVVSHGLDGFAHATEALVGHAIGARDREALHRAVTTATWWSGLVAVGFSLLYASLGWLLIDALTSLNDVRATAREFLPWMIVLPPIAMTAYQFDGVFLGAIRPKPMRNGMILALGVFAATYFGLAPFWGNHALWLALVLFLATRAVVLVAAYPRLRREATP